jgi:hypothetical protein
MVRVYRKLKLVLLPVTCAIFLFLNARYISNVNAFRCTGSNKYLVVPKPSRHLFVSYRISYTSLKAAKTLSLITPPPPPLPPLHPSLLDRVRDESNSLVQDVRQTLLALDSINSANLNDLSLKLSLEISKMVESISHWGREQYSILGISSRDFSLSAFSLDTVQGFGDNLSLNYVEFISKLQSTTLHSYHVLHEFLQHSVDVTSTMFPEYTFVASTIITFLAVNTALSQQSSSPSSPYPLNRYDALTARAYFDKRPLLVMLRALTIGSQSLHFGLSILLDKWQDKVDVNEARRGRELSALLTSLGPTFIKVGQSLSIRTDLLRPAYIRGLETLQDQVPAFDTKAARLIIETEWGKSITTVLSDDLSAEPIAAASLGQVYKARLRETNDEVAIKVQRPDIIEQIALDMHLIREIGGIVKRFSKLNTDVIGTVDAWGVGFIDELDYIQEAANSEKFSELILGTPLREVVFAPKVVKEFTTRSVLVSSWVNGDRLDRSNSTDVSLICSIAMNTYLTMLLEFGLLRTFENKQIVLL